jgi:hypothetical protein
MTNKAEQSLVGVLRALLDTMQKILEEVRALRKETRDRTNLFGSL